MKRSITVATEHGASTMTVEEQKAFADQVVWRALLLMQEEGVRFDVMMDRLLTAAGAHITSHDGPERTATIFRTLADNIDAGVLDGVRRQKAPTIQ